MPASTYQVTYTTPTCAHGTAHVTASGIFAALEEAATAIRILTGYDRDQFVLKAVIDSNGTTLWTSEN